jgi:hypothetical protein
MSLQGAKKGALLTFLSVFVFYGCNAQIKLDNPKSITSKIGGSIIVNDIGHYGNFFEDITEINFENYRNFSDGRPLPLNYAETFDIDKYDLGFMDKFVVSIKILHTPKKDSYMTINFQTNENIFNLTKDSIKTNPVDSLLPSEDLNRLFSNEYEAFIFYPDNTSEYYITDNYISEDFNEETNKKYNYYKQFRPILEKNFAVIKEYIDNKGWEKRWYVRDMPDRSLLLFKGVQTESYITGP